MFYAKLLKQANDVKDIVLYDNPWLQLKDRKGYIFSHESRCNGAIVLVLPYRRIGKDAWEFLVRDEVTPCWSDGPTRSAITGGVEHDQPIEDAARELKEEAGYTVGMGALKSLGKCRASKSSDTYYHLFAVDLSGMEPGEALGDGSKNDQAPSVWITGEEVVKLEDPQAITAYTKAGKFLGIY